MQYPGDQFDIKEAANRFADFSKAQMFQMATNDDNELNPLLAYNRDRLNNFDRERCEWLDKF